METETEKQEQVERGVLEYFRNSPGFRNWVEIMSNISTSSKRLELALKRLEEKGVIGRKMMPRRTLYRKTSEVECWYLNS